jgi:hypothetical protein
MVLVNIEPESVRRISQNLIHLGYKIIHIIVVQAEPLPACSFAVKRPPPNLAALLIDLNPLGMGSGGIFIPDHSGIDRAAYSLFVESLDHGSQEIEFEGRVHGPYSGGIIGITVVAFAKNIDELYPGVRQGLGEFLGVKINTHVRNEG